MLPTPYRLSKKADIERVQRRGRSFFYDLASIKALKTSESVSRFTVIASLKVSKRATKRNTLKRRIREIIRLRVLPAMLPGFDVVIFTKASMLEKSYQELETMFLAAFKKSRLIN